jgi:hypothetical protein
MLKLLKLNRRINEWYDALQEPWRILALFVIILPLLGCLATLPLKFPGTTYVSFFLILMFVLLIGSRVAYAIGNPSTKQLQFEAIRKLVIQYLGDDAARYDVNHLVCDIVNFVNTSKTETR